jgi:hypothetical protein
LDDVVTVTLVNPASGGMPFPDDNNPDLARLDDDIPASEPLAEAPELGAPLPDANDFIEDTDRRLGSKSEYDDLAVKAGPGNGA